METKSDNKHDKIELRSEKVRELIGPIPKYLIRWGTIIIILVFLSLLAAICLLPYPYSHGESILYHLIDNPIKWAN